MKMRATNGYRNSSLVTLKTFLTQFFSTLPRKSTRGTSEIEWCSWMLYKCCQGHQPCSLLTFIMLHKYTTSFEVGLPGTRLWLQQQELDRTVIFTNPAGSFFTFQWFCKCCQHLCVLVIYWTLCQMYSVNQSFLCWAILDMWICSWIMTVDVSTLYPHRHRGSGLISFLKYKYFLYCC